MFRRQLQFLALGTLISAAAATQAAAGSCCGGCWTPCVAPAPVVVAPAPVVVVQPVAVPVTPVYVVNQGPIYSGPGIMTYPGYFDEWQWPRFYPYVGVDVYAPLYRPYEPRRYYRHVSYHAKPAHHRGYRRPLDPADK
jgi:hypothetical protein